VPKPHWCADILKESWIVSSASFTDYSEPLAAQVCSLQAARSPSDLGGLLFELAVRVSICHIRLLAANCSKGCRELSQEN